MIPLMTRRSSTLGLPRVSLGRCGLSRANCSSLSQKKSRSINGLPSETLNQDAPRFGNQFMGPEPNVRRALERRDQSHLLAGKYLSYAEALKAVPRTRSCGWNNEEAAAIWTDKVDPVRPGSYPIFFWLRLLLRPGASVI